jgi:hypothetical protein
MTIASIYQQKLSFSKPMVVLKITAQNERYVSGILRK